MCIRDSHVIGRDAEMRGALFDHLQRRVQHAVHGAERRVLALVEAPLTVEVPEQLVGAVDEVNDQLYADRAASSAGPISSIERTPQSLSLIHISEPTRLLSTSYAVFCLKK